DPRDPQRMINGNDGGATVSENGGATWTTLDNQPTAQFYHVITTTHFPYRLCGAQQDNSTVCIASRTDRLGITDKDWYEVGGGESGWIAARQDDPDVVFAGSYGGYITRFDRRTGQAWAVNAWPDNPMGWGAAALKYRFQWTFPIVLSPTNPNDLYIGAQVLFKSVNDGRSWQVISPDLTRNETAKQGPSGGPITKDNTSIEYYNTIFTIAPSPRDSQLIWVGTDDGLVQVTRDGGKTRPAPGCCLPGPSSVCTSHSTTAQRGSRSSSTCPSSPSPISRSSPMTSSPRPPGARSGSSTTSRRSSS